MFDGAQAVADYPNMLDREPGIGHPINQLLRCGAGVEESDQPLPQIRCVVAFLGGER